MVKIIGLARRSDVLTWIWQTVRPALSTTHHSPTLTSEELSSLELTREASGIFSATVKRKRNFPCTTAKQTHMSAKQIGSNRERVRPDQKLVFCHH